MSVPGLFMTSTVALFLVAACEPDAKDPNNPGCLMVVRSANAGLACAGDINVDPPEKLRSMRQAAINRKAFSSHGLTAFCPDSVTESVLRAQDACIASIDALIPQATADAAKRRAIAGPAVDALRADARYAPARDKFHAQRVEQSVACDTTDGTACALARGDADAAAAVMRSLFAQHNIDLRDAEALGVW